MKKNFLIGLVATATLVLTGCNDSSSSDDETNNPTSSVDGTPGSVTNPTDTKQVYKYFADSADSTLSGSTSGDYGALVYGVGGGHKMWPTFDVFIFKDGANMYKMQVLSNYGETGSLSSANLYIRYAEVNSTTPSYTTLDATNASAAAKLKLSDGTTVSDDSWHIAYQKYVGFKSNGGTSGSGSVTVCQAKEYSALFSGGKSVQAEFEKLTKDNTLDAFNGITSDDCASGDYKADAIDTVIDFEDWGKFTADYSATPPSISYVVEDNATNGWIVRSASGDAYARVKIKSLDYSSKNFTITTEVYNTTANKFNEATDVVLSDYHEGYYDIETNSAVTSSEEWDIKVTQSGHSMPTIQVHGGASASGQGGVGIILGGS